MKGFFKIGKYITHFIIAMAIIFYSESACYAIGGFGVIVDSAPPVITLSGEMEVNLSLGDNYNDKGATAYDNIDGDISSRIVIDNSVDTNVSGSYIITYNVKDDAGNSAKAVTRTVNVIDTTPEYTVMFVPGEHGSISGTASQTVNQGEDCTSITANPDTNYHFVNWTGDGFRTTTANPLTVTGVINNHTITANFAINTYSVTFTSESHGSLTGITTQTVNHGNNCSSVNAVPEDYYRFTGWHGDYTGVENPLTIMDVTDNMNITASFEREDGDMDGVDTIGEMGPDGNNALYDGNNDGIPDSQQDDVASFYINLGVYRTLELSFIDGDDVEWDTRLEIIRNPDTYVIENYFPEDFEGESITYSGGFYSFIAYCEDVQIACGNGNFTPEVKIYFHEVLPVLGPGKSEVATWCDDSEQCYDFEYSDITGIGMLFPNRDGSDSIGGIKLKDGERGDCDGTINGKIEY